ncbi:hypothetical protein A0H81_04907 [Grifola frondosa]|uniref:Uncharacterized protein n=1 Tax=Grifola frondosa TaxID=5627 RepID=A0A1C7MF49_GRIFR|nr:hypothetical protein A0H81_04907 [Grifola frondosa]
MCSPCTGCSFGTNAHLPETCFHCTEPQPTMSRRRALTYMHTRVLLALQSQSQGSTASSAPFLALNDNNVRGQLATLALAGCTNFHGLHRDSLRVRFGSALACIGE